MQGYIPCSEQFMYQDPERVDEYREWQQFAKFLLIDEKLQAEKSTQVNIFRRRLKRYLTK